MNHPNFEKARHYLDTNNKSDWMISQINTSEWIVTSSVKCLSCDQTPIRVITNDPLRSAIEATIKFNRKFKNLV